MPADLRAAVRLKPRYEMETEFSVVNVCLAIHAGRQPAKVVEWSALSCCGSIAYAAGT